MGMGVSRPPLHRRITFAIMVPVVLAGLAVAALGNYFLTQPLLDFLHGRAEARLRLASQMALSICDELLEDVVNQRLEGSAQVREALQREAQAQLGQLRLKFPALQVLVLDEKGLVVSSTLSLPRGLDTSFLLGHGDQVRTAQVGGTEVRYHGRYFPYWGWHILSVLPTDDYLAPARRASYAVYLSTFGTLFLMLVSLILSFHWLVNRPLRGIIAAAGQVAQGRFNTIEVKRGDELGQLGQA
ncbi:MAG: hypothetical protein C0405_09460, partial [Desulfovibrio sp.]|nr:hypothetical protein [Desulfovibrio sp.]